MKKRNLFIENRKEQKALKGVYLHGGGEEERKTERGVESGSTAKARERRDDVPKVKPFGYFLHSLSIKM